MNMKKILLAFFVLSMGFTQNITAQNHHWCGTTYEAQVQLKAQLIHQRETMANTVHTRGDIQWVPIKFHILQDNNGGNRVDLQKVLEMLCAVNEDYFDMDIQFFIKDGFNFINSTSVNANPQPDNPFAIPVMTGAKDPGAVNMYIVKDIPTSTLGSTLGYYSPTFDWVVIRRTEISANKAETITHELGHFFSLPHPFHGWDHEPYDEATHGNPAPSTAPDGTPTELMDGSNCMTAGDGICDTRPNYLFGFGWSNCTFTGGIMDPNGTLVDPQEDNFMAYFIGCGYTFTQGQQDAIHNNLAGRANLQTSFDYDTAPLADAPTLNYPIGNEDTPLFNVVGLDWEAVSGADGYLVEVDRTASFSFNPSAKFVFGGTYIEFEDVFEADKKYYWRVFPLKNGSVCGTSSISESFRTGETTATSEIKEILNHSISPNPVSGKEMLNINIETNQGFDAKISLFSLSGQKMKEINHTFALGTTNYGLSVSDLSEGMYLLSIETEQGILNEKIVVTR